MSKVMRRSRTTGFFFNIQGVENLLGLRSGEYISPKKVCPQIIIKKKYF